MTTASSAIERVETYFARAALRRPLADSIRHRTHWRIPVEMFTSDDVIPPGRPGTSTVIDTTACKRSGFPR